MAYFSRPVTSARQSSYLDARSPSPTLELYDEASNVDAKVTVALRSLPSTDTVFALHAAASELEAVMRAKPNVHIFDPLLDMLRKMALAEEVEAERQKGLQILETCNRMMRDARMLSREMAEKKEMLVIFETVGSEAVWAKLIEQTKAAKIAMIRA
jgi:hypothetical protein